MLLAITVAPLMAHSAETTIRLTVGFELIGQKLADQVYTEAGNAQVWRESDCRYLSLDSPARLLTHTREKVLARAALDARHAPIYAPLLLATALKESCWRQYRRNRRGITYLKSTAGAIGLMQVNPRYWRGFYQVEQLQWNTAYNAHAGAEILMQYFRRYGLKEGQETSKLENAARTAYSVYNAGSRAAARYRAKGSSPRERKVDAAFWDLFQGFAADGKVHLQHCGVRAHVPPP